MEPLHHIQDFKHLKILADSRRLAILQRLMAQPMTLSQLGEETGEHPARVRHHLKQLEKAELVEMVETRPVRGFVEKYYRAKACSFLLQEFILPNTPGRETIAVLGSHDLALELLAKRLSQRYALDLLLLPIGSLEGLIALRQGAAQVAGCHLLDSDSGEYNLPYLRHIFPDRGMTLVTLAYRQQGLLLPPGNPKGIRGIVDLVRPDVTLVNRNRGSGTRLWLDRQLSQASIPMEKLRGYETEERTHTAVAHAVHNRRADVGLGLGAAARLHGLDFIPLFEERYDLALANENLATPNLQPLLNALQGSELRELLKDLEGYSSSHTGEQVIL